MIWLVVEITDFQGAVEIERTVGVFDTEDAAFMYAQLREVSYGLPVRVQGWPVNDTIE